MGRTAPLGGWPHASIPFTVQFWYPAASGRRRFWRRRVGSLRRGFEDVAERDAALTAAPATFPLLLYFSGWPGTGVDNRLLIGELASHGYAVAAIAYDGSHPDSRCRLDYSSQSAYRHTVALATQRVTARAADARALLDELSRLQATGDAAPLLRRLDLHRVGAAGFSFGGAVAAEVSTCDVRIRAVVNIDGRHWGKALQDGVASPYLFIGEELLMPQADALASPQPDRRYNAILDRHDYAQLAENLRRHGGVQVTIAGSAHLDFTDSALRLSLRKIPGTGTLAPHRVLHIVRAHVRQFFDQTLRGLPQPHWGGAAPLFAEARVEIWPPPITRPAESTPRRASAGSDGPGNAASPPRPAR